MPEDKLELEQFIMFMMTFPELVDPVKSVFRYEVWSERYRYSSEISTDENHAEHTSTIASTKMSKTSTLEVKANSTSSEDEKKKSIFNQNLFSKGKSGYITSESVDGQLEFFTQKVKSTKSGYLMKLRSECGDYVKRYYFLKKDFLYYYG